MTDELARSQLESVLESASMTVTNVVARGTSLEDSELTTFDVTHEMAERMAADVRDSASRLLKRQVVNYDPSYQSNSSQVLVEQIDQIPELASVDDQIRAGDLDADAGGPSVVAMAHALGLGDHQVVAYRTGGAGIAAIRRKELTLVPRDGIYEPVEGDVLFYEPKFDVFTTIEFAFFTNVSTVQNRLRATQKARDMARETLRQVTVSLAIEGFEQLEKAVMDDSNLRAKMASVARLLARDPDYASVLTTDRLIDFVQENPQYEIALGTHDGKSALKFDSTPQHRHQIPRLLADDYLFSRLTSRSYEAGSKHRVDLGG